MEEIRWEGQNFSEVVAPQGGGGGGGGEEEEAEEEEEEEEDNGLRLDILNYTLPHKDDYMFSVFCWEARISAWWLCYIKCVRIQSMLKCHTTHRLYKFYIIQPISAQFLVSRPSDDATIKLHNSKVHPIIW